MLYRQYKLTHGTTEMVVNLQDGQCKVGDQITLKNHRDPDELWDVVWQAKHAGPKPRTDWHNNI